MRAEELLSLERLPSNLMKQSIDTWFASFISMFLQIDSCGQTFDFPDTIKLN